MPLIQGGPPECVWERTPDVLKWNIAESRDPQGHTVYELRVDCGMGIMRLQFFTEEELQDLHSILHEKFSLATAAELKLRVSMSGGRTDAPLAFRTRIVPQVAVTVKPIGNLDHQARPCSIGFVGFS